MSLSFFSSIKKPLRKFRSLFIRVGIIAPPEDIDMKIADEQRQARRKLLFLKYRIPGGGKGS
jgi:hypothetical protein